MTSSPETTSNSSPTKKPFQLKFHHLLLPYLLGVTWTALHPILSVVTGELKCRGSYIDENGLDTNRVKLFDSYDYDSIAYKTFPPSQKGDEGGERQGLCAALEEEEESKSEIACHVHHHSTSDGETLPSFDIVKIVPNSSPVYPVESIVLVINSPIRRTWSESTFHASILKLIQRLGNAKKCPWLAKAILVVSPHSSSSSMENDENLEKIVESFLAAYNGVSSLSSPSSSPTKLLPLDYTSTMIRTLLVYNIQDSHSSSSITNTQPTIQILPQGKYGALPNLDLIFAVNAIYDQYFFRYRKGGGIVHHVYGEYVESLKRRLEEYGLSRKYGGYVGDLLGMLSFGYNLAVGPYPPHSHALNHGIDSLTITSQFSPNNNQQYAPKFVQNIEQTIRVLSNLHERLHHSITQYLLPSPSKFVSHGEYIYPIILILLSLVIRAGTLALRDIWRFHFRVGFGVAAGSILVGVSLMALTLSSSSSLEVVDHAAYMLIYLLVLIWIGYFLVLTRDKTQVSLSSSYATEQTEEEINEWKRAKQSIQFLACLMAIYLHVPIALSHVSLAYPSALLWCPLLAFPLYGSTKLEQQQQRFFRVMMIGMKTIFACLILFVSWPPIFLVPKFFSVYSTYVLLVYTPLHLFLATLWLF